MSIAYDAGKIKLNENKFAREGYEIVSATGRMLGESRTIVVYGVYLPPNLIKSKANRAAEIISDNITEIETKFESPIICLSGDFNQFGLNNIIADHPDIKLLNSPPTRKEAKLDLIATNIEQFNKECFTSTPLEGYESVSDHKPLVSVYAVPSSHSFSIVKYKTRKYTKKNEEKFVEELTIQTGVNYT